MTKKEVALEKLKHHDEELYRTKDEVGKEVTK